MSIDLLFLLFIVFFAIVGYVRGFINQVVSVLMILSVIAFAKPLADWLKYDSGWKWFQKSSELVAWGLAAFGILLVWMGIHGLIILIKKSPGLSPMDRWVGGALGMVKGVVLVLMLGVIYQTLPEDSRQRFADLDKDAQKSVFMSMSKGISTWDSVAIFKSLHDTRERLANTPLGEEILDDAEEILPDAPQKKSERRTPWLTTE